MVCSTFFCAFIIVLIFSFPEHSVLRMTFRNILRFFLLYEENLYNKKGQTDGTPVDKYYFAWTKNVTEISIIEGPNIYIQNRRHFGLFSFKSFRYWGNLGENPGIPLSLSP